MSMSARRGARMRTIALISQKGGAGKTTIALHLAAAFQLAGEDTIVLDLDPQRSSYSWSKNRGSRPPEVLPAELGSLVRIVEQARKTLHGFVVCDTAPHTEATAKHVARIADFVLVPCRPNILDLQAMTSTIKLVKSMGTPAFAVLNHVPSFRKAAADEAEFTISQELGLPVAPIRLGQLVAYADCMNSGAVAQESEPGGKAAQEMEQLCAWLVEALHTTGALKSGVPS